MKEENGKISQVPKSHSSDKIGGAVQESQNPGKTLAKETLSLCFSRTGVVLLGGDFSLSAPPCSAPKASEIRARLRFESRPGIFFWRPKGLLQKRERGLARCDFPARRGFGWERGNIFDRREGFPARRERPSSPNAFAQGHRDHQEETMGGLTCSRHYPRPHLLPS